MALPFSTEIGYSILKVKLGGDDLDTFAREMALRRQKRRRKRRNRFTTVIVVLVALAAAGLWMINQIHADVKMNGDEEITLEYGQSYLEPGATGELSGLMQLGKSLDVSISGGVNDQQVGTYTVTYSTKWGFWSAEVQRIVHVVDNVAPRIILRNRPGSYTIPGQPYVEVGFAAADNHDGIITNLVQRIEQNGKVIYRVEDSSGNQAEAVRDIVYYDPIPPELILTGGESITVSAGASFTDPGFTAQDNSAGEITGRVKVSGKVNPYRAGTYELRYRVEDVYDNVTTVVRTVEVKAVEQPKTVKPEEKVIYLTFDDGPGPYTERLLEILREYDVKATFFVCNTNPDYVDVITTIAEDGHSIGIHTVTHDYHTIYASEDAYFADLYGMQQIILEKTGKTTSLVRFPGGGSNTVSRFNEGIMTRLAACLWDMGFQYFDWNVDSDDAGRAKTTKRVIKNVTEGIEDRDYAIVLQHDTKDFSVEAVAKIIEWGLENGYEFRSLDPTSPTCHHGIRN